MGAGRFRPGPLSTGLQRTGNHGTVRAMSRTTRVVGLALLLAALFASPASPATNIARQVKALDRKINAVNKRVNALVALRLLDQSRTPSTRVESTPITFNGTTAAAGTATCTAGRTATGGGASFNEPQYGDHVIYSRPSGTNGWTAAIARSGNAFSLGAVYVLCMGS